MRDFTRITLRLLLIGFLVVGCVHNVWYLGELTKNAHNTSYGYSRNSYYNRNNTYVDAEEIEEVPADTSQVTDYEDEYPEYNRQTRPVTYY
jgi:hypothetical protein